MRRDVPALTRSRLSWVQQNYIRSDTLAAANAKLVEFQSEIPLALAWGGGEVASADGLRFVVPVRTINARPNSKYFGTERGITYYNFTSDQFTGFHGIVIPGTLRDSMFVLDGLLEQQTSLKPLELMTDTAGVSDVVFGLFWLLGYHPAKSKPQWFAATPSCRKRRQRHHTHDQHRPGQRHRRFGNGEQRHVVAITTVVGDE